MTGVYSRIRPGFRATGCAPAVFLDRDGVVLQDTGYLCRPEDMAFSEGATDAILALNRAGLPIVVVTNQAGVGLGMYTWSDFEAVQTALEAKLRESGAWLDGVWACAWHEKALTEFQESGQNWRKPNPAMLQDAAQRMGLDPSRSWMVGDRLSDLEAGLAAGVRRLIHVETGYGAENRVQVRERFPEPEPVRFCRDIRGAVSTILAEYRAE